ncbi:Predicted dehydrogenase [Anaerosphaera aminiphila DSM 21120]|uniref:Predicted dehydrogenase n=1 Tax=Anaerosphaera aminiphila DSM 21120 TaxID=1120995 RepID=A0A1M5QRR3_9FIRM|nr:Gfo/Idh/MocA family oxidoreductase [Anaerosphaera aminiphila]SHH16814.1 Predicted dehydrogenase [Anaerosphaera aminiphila DSM 21120]
MGKKLRYGMVGGGPGAFIGNVHRKAIASEGTAELVAGCFSTNFEKNLETGDFYNIDKERIYRDYREMAEREKQREDKIDFVSIVTPNSTHFEISKAFLEADIHVMCEKPLCFTSEEAEELYSIAKERNLFFGVMYTYSGYPMVKLAKKFVEDGEIGEIVNVSAEYLQDWLIDQVGGEKQSETKLSVWRTDPKKSGISNCVGDIGSHIENTVAYITGLRPKKLLSVLDYYKMDLDLNANILVEYENGVHGVYSCSQVCVGHLNGLVVRVFGTEGSVEWAQEDPNYLKVTKKNQPEQIYHRGTDYITGRAAELNHIPAGHPEGIVFAVANHYNTFISAIVEKNEGMSIENINLDFPKVEDGVSGVKFIEAAVASSKEGNIWKEV